MSVAVHAELTAAGDRIVLVAGGPVEDVAYMAKQLQQLTPLIKQSDPKGALLMPATWPAVVQLAAVYGDAWRPGPRLQAWILAQTAARVAPVDAPLSVPVPNGLTPRPYQVAGANLIAATGHTLITDEPGTGKTITTILGLAQWLGTDGFFLDTSKLPILVIAPASVVDPWVEALRTWAPYWTTVAWRGAPKRRLGLIGTADVYVTSYDTARMDAGNTNPGQSPLIALNARALVADECFPAGTLIATPDGQRPIEALQPGDEVIGIDHTTGEPVVTTVKHTFCNRTLVPLTSVNGIRMTTNHPVWTTRGYVPAAHVGSTHQVAHTLIRSHDGEIHADVRVVRATVHEGRPRGQASAVLQSELLGEVAYVATGLRRVARYAEASCGIGGEHAALARESAGPGGAASAPARAQQSAAGSGRAGEGADHAPRAGLPDAERRQRAADSAPETAGRADRLGDGVPDPHRAQAPVPEGLQGRSGLAGADDRYRDRRGEPQESVGASSGHPTGRTADIAGLAGPSVHERSGARRDGRRDGPDHHGRVVYNIETGTGNYLAGGLLVHNCHLIKNPHAARTNAVRRLARNVKAFVALSGTPITHHPGDLWPTLTCLAPGAWPSRERWVNRYCTSGVADYGESILGLNPGTEPEFRLTLLGQQRRVAKADVLDQLPPKVYSVRTVELPPAYRTAYDAMESDMLAELPDGGELGVMDALSQLTCLSRLACSAADAEITFETVEDGMGGTIEKRHVHLELKAPSWKVDALLEVLEERPGKPVVVFAPSAQLIKLAGFAATAAGHRVGYVIGGQSMKDRTETVAKFQAGELDLICATTGAGGVGITLTAASTVVFLQRPWSLVESLQAEDRCHRIGSEIHECVEIVDIVAANTIDTRVRSVLREKAGQLADLVQDPRIVAELLGGASISQLRKVS